MNENEKKQDIGAVGSNLSARLDTRITVKQLREALGHLPDNAPLAVDYIGFYDCTTTILIPTAPNEYGEVVIAHLDARP